MDVYVKEFEAAEFDCRCGCGRGGSRGDMHLDFLVMLAAARKLAGCSFNIISGFRCPSHNKDVGGSADSAHIYGMAADIHCVNSNKRFRIIKSLLDVGFTRIGVARTYVHVDNDNTKPHLSIWDYYKKV